VRFRFGDFTLSPRQRLLLRNGRPVALIPKYFDLLVLLILRRHDAVSKNAIFAEVWSDVVVSDGALAQAVRTLRRTLGDDVREPRFIRTVSRYGYQFVWPNVTEEADDDPVSPATPRVSEHAPPAASMVLLVDRLMTATSPEDARDLAEQLHALGTAGALAHLTARPGHAQAVAMMRDARWSVPGAGDVPLLRDPEAFAAVMALIRLRLSDVKRTVVRRWASAAETGAIAGGAAGFLGGLALYLAPTSNARPQSSIALAAIGILAGGMGAAGVGAGLVTAEVLARSRRALALVACGALAGALVGGAAAIVLGALLEGLFGLHLVNIAGGPGALDGLVLGAAAGVGYAATTSHPDGGGLAAPRGRRRIVTAAAVGACCALGAAALTASGRPLVGGLVHEIARSSRDAELVLGPLGHLVGEPGFGPETQVILSTFEGAAFGCALGWGLTRRPAIDRNARE
jgi:DNA-binding winged helix-turn-helix (wHTH) protein